MHDSTAAGIDLNRMLGKDAEVQSVPCGTISGALAYVRSKESLEYDYYMTGCGINDLKTKSVNDVMSDMEMLVGEIKLRSTSISMSDMASFTDLVLRSFIPQPVM